MAYTQMRIAKAIWEGKHRKAGSLPWLLTHSYYYRHGVAKAIFSKVDCKIFKAIWAWVKRRHPCKGQRWIKNKYFCRVEHNNWVFNAGLQPTGGRYKLLRLMRTIAISIVRHIKVRAEAQPYDPKYSEYFEYRARRKVKAYFDEIAGSKMAL